MNKNNTYSFLIMLISIMFYWYVKSYYLNYKITTKRNSLRFENNIPEVDNKYYGLFFKNRNFVFYNLDKIKSKYIKKDIIVNSNYDVITEIDEYHYGNYNFYIYSFWTDDNLDSTYILKKPKDKNNIKKEIRLDSIEKQDFML